jgi:hypothetical protein
MNVPVDLAVIDAKAFVIKGRACPAFEAQGEP